MKHSTSSQPSNVVGASLNKDSALEEQNMPLSQSAWYLPAIVLLYLLLLPIGSLSASGEGGSSNVDEIFILLSTPVAVFGMYRLGKDSFIPFLFLGAYYVFYIASSINMSLVSNPIMPVSAVLVGGFLELKVVIFLCMVSFLGYYYISPYERERSFRLTLIVLVLFATSSIPFYLYDIFSSGTSALGIPLRKSGIFGYIPIGFFTHKLATATVSAMGIAASAALFCYGQRIRYLLSLIVLIVFLMLADSVKELAVIPVSFLVVTQSFIRSQRNLNHRVSLIILTIISVPILLVLTWMVVGSSIQKRSDVYGNETTVRGMMYDTSISIAQENFPLGSGGGTFGSQPTRSIQYSPLYYRYGFQYHYGSSPKYPVYIMDTWWPKVTGEAGFVGGIFYILSIIFPLIVVSTIAIKKSQFVAAFGMMSGVTLFSMSLASAVFTDAIGILFVSMFWLSYILRNDTSRPIRE